MWYILSKLYIFVLYIIALCFVLHYMLYFTMPYKLRLEMLFYYTCKLCSIYIYSTILTYFLQKHLPWIQLFYNIGYGLSLIALLIAVTMMLYFRYVFLTFS